MKHQLPKKLVKAFAHVSQYYPNVCFVVFNPEGRWQYMDENFKAPIFDGKINVSILEEAADEVDNLYSFPCAFASANYPKT